VSRDSLETLFSKSQSRRSEVSVSSWHLQVSENWHDLARHAHFPKISDFMTYNGSKVTMNDVFIQISAEEKESARKAVTSKKKIMG